MIPLIPDPAAAARAWHDRHGAIQVNHLVTVKAALSREQPAVVEEIYRMLTESKRRTGPPAAAIVETTPFGVEANRRNLEVAVDVALRQRLIPRRFSVDELFDEVTRALA